MELRTSVFANGTGTRRQPCKSSDQEIALHLRYAKIGILAVAAAARYQSGTRNLERPAELQRCDDATA